MDSDIAKFRIKNKKLSTTIQPLTINLFELLVVKLGFEDIEAFEAIVEMKLIMRVPKVIIKKK